MTKIRRTVPDDTPKRRARPAHTPAIHRSSRGRYRRLFALLTPSTGGPGPIAATTFDDTAAGHARPRPPGGSPGGAPVRGTRTHSSGAVNLGSDSGPHLAPGCGQ